MLYSDYNEKTYFVVCPRTKPRWFYILNLFFFFAASKGGNSSAAMAAEMQRVAEAQRQYLLDMIPGHSRNPWTKN